MPRKLMFSVTKKDLIVETFRAGGKGGQNQNKRDTGVRIKHPDSGAVGEGRDQRSQGQNKKAAFERMVASKQFQTWLRRQTGRHKAIEAEIDSSLDERNLKIERKVNGKWVPWQ